MTDEDTGFRRSGRTRTIGLSEIARISETARARREAGNDVLSFGTGEPDFPTPPHVIDAAFAAARGGQTTYPPTAGTAALRGAIAERAGVAAADVIVSTGAKQVLSNALLATVDPGDEVIIPAPYWTSYADMADFCGARAVTPRCTAESGFRLTSEQLEDAIGPRTRWLMLNNPGNPSGALYGAEELSALADVLRAHPHVWVLADEIYEHIAYEPFTSFRNVAPDLANRMLIVNGVSKAYAMTGWRIGWGIGPAPLVAAMTAVQGQSTSGACSVSQAAALAAITGPQDLLGERCDEFRARRDFVVGALGAIPGLTCPLPGGAFYAFPDCTGCIGKLAPGFGRIGSDADLCRYLLERGDVALVPGRAFGLPGHFRLSYAYAMNELKEGCARIARALADLEEGA